MAQEHYFLYIIECNNGSYYTGYCADLKDRYRKHRAGKAAKYTRANPPRKIAAAWKIEPNRSTAQKLEAGVKSLSRPEKDSLVKYREPRLTQVLGVPEIKSRRLSSVSLAKIQRD